MFHPSHNLLFRPMPALKKLKIHHPLPLNPRESEQLLNILTTSFRKHLDHEHPPFRTDNIPRPYPQSFTTSTPTRRRSSDTAAHPADQHLSSLLGNPLFSLSPGGKDSKSDTDPMELFEKAVAKGMMDTRYAYACLRKEREKIVKSHVLNIRDGMKESGAGLKVLKWLVSSGTANNNEFLKHTGFSELLMQFMVAEGLQEVAWVWIKRAIEGRTDINNTEVEARLSVGRPLIFLMKAESAWTGVSLDTAYLCLTRAAGYFKSAPVREMRSFLNMPGTFLAKATFFGAHGPSSEANFESFLSLVPAVFKDSDYCFAHLNVLHPTKPTPDFALDYLSKHMDVNMELPKTIRAEAMQNHSRIHLCLDTARLLLETKRYGEAHWVMDLLRSKYPRQLGVEEDGQLKQARAEASTLRLLEGLSLA
ncbi:hypothetical protein NA56DRAFT_372306 [Hyaloscypha hepaticicola]|uniref:Uncharacterized protein n=1 Tax=Hyaloscypha hepaticicola TaxID=2082293 RepID=A0A2J6PKF8_9HELO|nr:hypothetical protein NA56DRAFT_372306 [Hyaloscypha hepaticicola]